MGLSRRGFVVGSSALGGVESTSDRWYEIDVSDHVAAVAAIGTRRVAFVVRQLERNGKVGYINSGSRSGRARLVLADA